MDPSGAGEPEGGDEAKAPGLASDGDTGSERSSAQRLADLLQRRAALVGATQAAGFAVEQVDGRRALCEVAHLGAGDDPGFRAAALSGLRKMARRCLDSGEASGAFGIDGTHDGEGMKFCLVSILSDAAGPRAAVAVVARCRDRDDVRRRLELLCGAE